MDELFVVADLIFGNSSSKCIYSIIGIFLGTIYALTICGRNDRMPRRNNDPEVHRRVYGKPSERDRLGSESVQQRSSDHGNNDGEFKSAKEVNVELPPQRSLPPPPPPPPVKERSKRESSSSRRRKASKREGSREIDRPIASERKRQSAELALDKTQDSDSVRRSSNNNKPLGTPRRTRKESPARKTKTVEKTQDSVRSKRGKTIDREDVTQASESSRRVSRSRVRGVEGESEKQRPKSKTRSIDLTQDGGGSSSKRGTSRESRTQCTSGSPQGKRKTTDKNVAVSKSPSIQPTQDEGSSKRKNVLKKKSLDNTQGPSDASSRRINTITTSGSQTKTDNKGRTKETQDQSVDRTQVSGGDGSKYQTAASGSDRSKKYVTGRRTKETQDKSVDKTQDQGGLSKRKSVTKTRSVEPTQAAKSHDSTANDGKSGTEKQHAKNGNKVLTKEAHDKFLLDATQDGGKTDTKTKKKTSKIAEDASTSDRSKLVTQSTKGAEDTSVRSKLVTQSTKVTEATQDKTTLDQTQNAKDHTTLGAAIAETTNNTSKQSQYDDLRKVRRSISKTQTVTEETGLSTESPYGSRGIKTRKELAAEKKKRNSKKSSKSKTEDNDASAKSSKSNKSSKSTKSSKVSKLKEKISANILRSPNQKKDDAAKSGESKKEKSKRN